MPDTVSDRCAAPNAPGPSDAIDTTRCPLCGQANACAVAAGAPAAGCWCMAAPVSHAALARLPTHERGRRCLCPHCARGLPVPGDQSPGVQ